MRLLNRSEKVDISEFGLTQYPAKDGVNDISKQAKSVACGKSSKQERAWKSFQRYMSRRSDEREREDIKKESSVNPIIPRSLKDRMNRDKRINSKNQDISPLV